MERANAQGTIESHEWPAKLAAHVVEPGSSPRIHGYDVQRDLAVHYTPTDIAFLALTSDLPVDAETSRALEVAMAFLAPASVAEPPAHAASLAQISGARPAGVVAVAAVALAEQARVLYDEHAAIIPRLLIGSLNGSAATVAARSEEERASVRELRAALGSFTRRVPSLGYDLRLETAILAVLLACGVRTREQLEVVVTLARLPAACAEAFGWKPGDLRAYPMDLPHFEYQG